MNALVTGGSGFLGLAIVRKLLARGDKVRSFSRTRHTELDRLGVEQISADLGDREALTRAAAGCDFVFHVAAKAGIWGSAREYEQTNFYGTENVLYACQANNIRRLVYTSSPSVVFDGRDEEGIDESTPYPKWYLAHYPRTKAMAERLVLSANGVGLSTVSLRPHLIWGPGDNHLIPRLVARAKAGKLRRIGDGQNRVDTIYIDNAADAHLLAADRLGPDSPIAGKAYFLSNDEPVNLWEFINRILACANAPPVTRGVSARTAYAVGAILETLYKVIPLRGEPPMTRFLAKQLSTSHWFVLSAAKRDLGYKPAVSIDEGLKRLRDHFVPA